MGEKQASTTDATAKPPLAALAPRATHKPLAEVLMGLVEGLCPACAGPDLHSAALNDEAAVSCGDCGWFATYRALRERVAALRESALERALAESLRLQSHYAVLLNHHDGGARRIFPSIESWLDRL